MSVTSQSVRIKLVMTVMRWTVCMPINVWGNWIDWVRSDEVSSYFEQIGSRAVNSRFDTSSRIIYYAPTLGVLE